MGKKSKRQRSNKQQQPHQADDSKRVAPSQRQSEEETLETLRFQDPFVDEVVDDEEDVDVDIDAADHGDKDMPEDGDFNEDVEVIQSWHPLMGGTPPEDLEMDPSAYKLYHTLSPEWPCLSFDFLRDSLGDARQRFPHSLQAVIGTQADSAQNNQVTVLKLSDLSKLPQYNDDDDDDLGDELNDDNDDSSSSSDEDVDLDPVMEHYSLPHYGGVNRIRAMPQSSDVVATWSDVGKVHIFDIAHLRARFQASEGKASLSNVSATKNPTFTYAGHGIEGYALDWSLVNPGHLATGDNHGAIHLWTPREGGSGYQVTPSYKSTAKDVSVEEIQWSPSESTVFCTAESGGHVSIYDTRAPNRCMLRHLAHESTDVNVASWNRHVSNLLATGSDDGTLSVWDLRQFSKAPPLARFSCHQTPITSVEWHPTDESMLAASDSVGAYIYDLSVEEDTNTPTQQKQLVADIPPQLLFCHSGSQDFKELHWHPQIASCIMTTAYSGFSVFIPSNL